MRRRALSGNAPRRRQREQDSVSIFATTFEFLWYTSNVKQRADSVRIERPGQVRALASPVRQEVVDALEAAGACTMAELAALVGRPADALYFHVRALMKVGLVVEAEPFKDGRHVAARYALAGERVQLAYDVPHRALLPRVVAAAVRMSLREYAAALEEPAGRDDPRGGRHKGWLTASEAERARGLLEELCGLIRAGRPREGTRPYALAFVLGPCVEHARVQRLGGRAGGGKTKRASNEARKGAGRGSGSDANKGGSR